MDLRVEAVAPTDATDLGDHYAGEEVVVLGGAGFLGSRLARRLVDLQACVTVVDSFHPSCGGNPTNLEGYGDRLTLVREPMESFAAAGDFARYLAIFNCVGLADHHLGFQRPALDYELNCGTGLRLLQELARDARRPGLVALGTRSQYGAGEGSLAEDSALLPLDVQAIHKTTLEHYHRVFAAAHGLDVQFVRLANVYGPGQRLSGGGIGFMGELLRAALVGARLQIYGGLERRKDLLYVDDAVEALLRVALVPAQGCAVYNVGGPGCRIRDLVRSLQHEFPGLGVDVVPFPEHIERIDTGDALLDIGKVREATGWEPRTSIDRGVALAVDFYRAHAAEYL